MASRRLLALALVMGAILLRCAQGQILMKGSCPQVPVLKNFDWNWYQGKWYEQERFFAYFKEMGRCWRGNYYYNPSTGGMSLAIYFNDLLSNAIQRVDVNVFAKDPYHAPSRLTYTLPGFKFFQGDYQVLSTDYVSYTVEFACAHVSPLGHVEYAWVLTRAAYPSYDVMRRAKASAYLLGIDTSYLAKVSGGC